MLDKVSFQIILKHILPQISLSGFRAHYSQSHELAVSHRPQRTPTGKPNKYTVHFGFLTKFHYSITFHLSSSISQFLYICLPTLFPYKKINFHYHYDCITDSRCYFYSLNLHGLHTLNIGLIHMILIRNIKKENIM